MSFGSKIDDVKLSVERSALNLKTLYASLPLIKDSEAQAAIKKVADDLTGRLSSLVKEVQSGVSLPSVLPSWFTRDEDLYSTAIAIEKDVHSAWLQWSKAAGRPLPETVKPPRDTSLTGTISTVARSLVIIAAIGLAVWLVIKSGVLRRG